MAADARGFAEALWRSMAELGWPGLLVPPEHGGSGGSLLDVVLLVEEMGYAVPARPLRDERGRRDALLAAAGSARPAAAACCPCWPPASASPRWRWSEESGSSDPADVALACAVPGRLTGRKLFVKDAHVADHLIVAVARGRGPEPVRCCRADRRGISRLPLEAISGEKLFEVAFDGVAIARRRSSSAPAGGGAAALAPALAAGRAGAHAPRWWAARSACSSWPSSTRRTRVQGGRPIGGYQAIQHACADLVRDVDAARGLALSRGVEEREGQPAEAPTSPWPRRTPGEACLAVARRGHQIFGAISYCEEHPLHLFHKRIQAAAVDFGDANHHLETVARSIGLV